MGYQSVAQRLGTLALEEVGTSDVIIGWDGIVLIEKTPCSMAVTQLLLLTLTSMSLSPCCHLVHMSTCQHVLLGCWCSLHLKPLLQNKATLCHHFMVKDFRFLFCLKTESIKIKHNS